MRKKGYTDYPIQALGDAPHECAPVRSVVAIGFDQNKYVTVEVAGIITQIKAGYIYRRPGRCGEVPPVKFEKYRGKRRKA